MYEKPKQNKTCLGTSGLLDIWKPPRPVPAPTWVCQPLRMWVPLTVCGHRNGPSLEVIKCDHCGDPQHVVRISPSPRSRVDTQPRPHLLRPLHTQICAEAFEVLILTYKHNVYSAHLPELPYFSGVKNKPVLMKVNTNDCELPNSWSCKKCSTWWVWVCRERCGVMAICPPYPVEMWTMVRNEL